MKKREIRKLVGQLYKEGKTRQETFDILITKIKKPITYIADIIRFLPPIKTRRKFNAIYWILISFIMFSQLVIILSVTPFFFKSELIIKLLWDAVGFENGNEFIIYLIPFIIWASCLSLIIIHHLKHNLKFHFMYILYYVYTIIAIPIGMVLRNHGNYLYNPVESDLWKANNKEIGKEIAIVLLSEIILSILIITLTIIIEKKMAPKYKKVQTQYIDPSGKKRIKSIIKFSD